MGSGLLHKQQVPVRDECPIKCCFKNTTALAGVLGIEKLGKNSIG
jgi:hypothetical protein